MVGLFLWAPRREAVTAMLSRQSIAGTCMNETHITCELTPMEIQARREALLPGLLEQARERVELADGYRWRFEPTGPLLAAVSNMIDAERQCCRFLKFVLTLELNGGDVWLEITGPPGTVDVLDTLSDA